MPHYQLPTSGPPDQPEQRMKERSLRDLFHLVKRVLPEEQQVISVRPDTTAADALSLMRRHGFNQLPVLEVSLNLAMTLNICGISSKSIPSQACSAAKRISPASLVPASNSSRAR